MRPVFEVHSFLQGDCNVTKKIKKTDTYASFNLTIKFADEVNPKSLGAFSIQNYHTGVDIAFRSAKRRAIKAMQKVADEFNADLDNVSKITIETREEGPLWTEIRFDGDKVKSTRSTPNHGDYLECDLDTYYDAGVKRKEKVAGSCAHMLKEHADK